VDAGQDRQPDSGRGYCHPETSLSLEGQVFTLDWYLSASGEQVQVLPDTEVTAEVKEGRIGGSSGCNSYSASFEVEGSEVKIGPIVSTLMACPDPVMEQEGLTWKPCRKPIPTIYPMAP